MNHQPYYTRRTQNWAIDNERQKHKQALFTLGEPALFTMMWRVEDFEAGLVGRCPRCAPDPYSIQGMIADTYKQALDARCPLCYGTTFDGGIRAQIIRPAIFTDTDEDEKVSARGSIHPESCTIESTHDFRTRSGDYVFRRDGSRWQLAAPHRIQLRTGYEHPTQDVTSLGYGRIQANREDKSSVAYDIPPDSAGLFDLLDNQGTLPERSGYDIVNGPLIPSTEIE